MSNSKKKSRSPAGKDRRHFPRRPAQARVKLTARRAEEVVFAATLPARDLSIGGVFLSSEFFIKPGTRLQVEFQPGDASEHIVVEGTVVRQERVDARSGKLQSGFAIQFDNYLDDAKLVLANHFLAPQVKRFVDAYLDSGRSRRLRNESDRLVDVVVAWELDRYEKDYQPFMP